MIRLPIPLLVISVSVSVAGVAAAQPAPEPKLEERLAAIVGRAGGLSSEEVARRSEETSRDVRARSAEVRSAQAAVAQARAAFYPRATLTARYTRLSDTSTGALFNLVSAPSVGAGPVPPGTELVNVPLEFPVLVNNYTLQAQLTVPISDYFLRIPQGTGAAKSGAEAARQTEQVSRRQARLNGRVLYYQWAQARLQIVVAEQALEAAQAHLGDVKKAANVGAASNADVLRVESQVAAAELLVVRVKNLADLLETQLRTTMHDDSGRPYEIGEDLATALGQAGAGDADVAAAGERRPEVKALSEAAAAARQQAKVARAGIFPRLDAVGNLIYANPNPRVFPQSDSFEASWDVSLQLTWTPFDIPSARAQQRQAEARAAQLDAQRAQVVDGVRIEVTQAENAVREADAAVATTARGLAAAEESYRVRRVLFQNGRATTVELTDAETELTRARLEAIDARVAQRVARARLAHALGQ